MHSFFSLHPRFPLFFNPRVDFVVTLHLGEQMTPQDVTIDSMVPPDSTLQDGPQLPVISPSERCLSEN